MTDKKRFNIMLIILGVIVCIMVGFHIYDKVQEKRARERAIWEMSADLLRAYVEQFKK